MSTEDVLSQAIGTIPSVAILLTYLRSLAGRMSKRLDAVEAASKKTAGEVAVIKAALVSAGTPEIADRIRELEAIRAANGAAA